MTSRPVPFPFTCPVAGVSFRPDTVARCQPGDQLVVRRDPTNPHDRAACAVHRTDGDQVGYLPKAIAGRMTGPGPWTATIVDVLPGQSATGLRIRVDGPTTEPGPDRQPATVTASPADTAPQDPPATVTTRSGRLLGRFAGQDTTTVQVADADGRVVTYPADLVVVAEPAPAW